MTKKKLLAWSDSASAGTGFGTVSKYILTALHKTGQYEIHHLAINFHGDFLDTKEIPWQVQPARLLDPKDPHGLKMFIRTLLKNEYDIVWVLNDLFVTHEVAALLEKAKTRLANMGRKIPKIVYYYPVDCSVPEDGCDFIKACDIPVCYTSHGKEETLKTLPTVANRLIEIPHGVDTSVFSPVELSQIEIWKRQIFHIAPMTTMVVNINRNSTRKQIQYSLVAFKEFRKHVPDSIMYLHTLVKDQGGDIVRAIKSLGLDPAKDIVFPTRFSPANPVPPDTLNAIYNCGDIFLTTHLGEGWGLCLDSSTILNTSDNCIPIKDICVGDEVVGQDGKFHKVLDTTYRVVNEAYAIRPMYSPEIISTKEHPFLVLKDPNILDPEWCNVRDISVGDFVAVVKPDGETPLPKSIDLLEYIDRSTVEFDDNHIWYKIGYSPKKNGMSISDIQEHFEVSKRVAEDARRCLLGSSLPSRGLPGSYADSIARAMRQEGMEPNTAQAKISRHIPVSDEFLYFIGWYLAEGSNGNKHRVELDLHIDERPLANRLANFAKEHFGLEPVVEQSGEKKCSLRLASGVLANVLGEMCGVHAPNKRVPAFLMKSSCYLGQLIRGLFEGDGHFDYNKRTISLHTTSVSLAYQARHICASNGILLGINEEHIRDQANFIPYTCQVATPHLLQWFRITGIGQTVVRQIPAKPCQHFIETDDYFFVKIHKIEHLTNIQKEVYDICVEDSHSFVANGILAHNTITEAMAAGTPVVAPNNTCMPQQLGEKSERGYMYPCNDLIWIDNSGYRMKGNIPDIVDKMMEAHSAGPKRDNAKVKAALKWAKKHDWTNITKSWVKLFKNIDQLKTKDEVETEVI